MTRLELQTDGYTLTGKMRKARREFPLTSTEQALYYELIAICNEGGWTEVFSCSCAELCYTLQITTNTLVKARMALINAGLISYKSGKSKRQFSSYSFTTVSKIDRDVGTDKGTDRGRDKGTDDEKKLTTLINNTNNTNKTKTKVVFNPPELEEVREYFKEKGFYESIADKFHEYYSSANWHDSKGNKVKSWKQKAQSVWFKDENKIKEPVAKQYASQDNNHW